MGKIVSKLKHSMPDPRSRFWLFTWNNYDATADYKGILSGLPNLTYLVYGHEVAPTTATKHLQGYLEFSVRTKLSTLKNLKQSVGLHCHWEVPKFYQNWQECRAYCVKEGGDIFEWGAGEFDKVNSRKRKGHGRGGERTDLDDVREAIADKRIKTTTDLESFVGLTYQGLLFGDRLLRNARPERDCVPDIYWLHGRTGVGKSRYAHEFIERIEQQRGWRSWVAYDGRLKWFDGYAAQEIALFDDFRGGDCHFPTLLRVCDRYVCRVEVKGGSAWWCPRVIIFTSSQSLEVGFGHLGSDDRSEQFARRVREEGRGGEFDFNKREQLADFRNRIDGYLAPSVAVLSSGAQAEDPEGGTEAEASAEAVGAGAPECDLSFSLPVSPLVGAVSVQSDALNTSFDDLVDLNYDAYDLFSGGDSSNTK